MQRRSGALLFAVGFLASVLTTGLAEANHNFDVHFHNMAIIPVYGAPEGPNGDASLRGRTKNAVQTDLNTASWTKVTDMLLEYKGIAGSSTGKHHYNHQVTYDHVTNCHFLCSRGGGSGVAQSQLYCHDGSTPRNARIPCPGSHGVLTYIHIWIDPNESWYKSTNSPSSTQLDLWSALEHELGHHGLADLYNAAGSSTYCPGTSANSTMCALYYGRIWNRDPNSEDIASANAAY